MLGAAGCKYTEKDAYCGHCQKEEDKFTCLIYGELKTHSCGEPVRAELCGDEWNIEMKDRNKKISLSRHN